MDSSDPVFPARHSSPNADAERRAVAAFCKAAEPHLECPGRTNYHFFWSGGILPAISNLSFPAAYRIVLNDPDRQSRIYLWTYNHRDLAEMSGEPWQEEKDEAMYSGFMGDVAPYTGGDALFSVVPAHMLLPGCTAGRHVESGMSIAHLSDLVRFLAVRTYGGVLMDVDCVLLRPVEKKRFFSTCEPKRSGGVAQKEAYWQRYGVTDLWEGSGTWDGRGILCYPVGAEKHDPIIESVVTCIEASLVAARKKKRGLRRWGLTTDVLREAVCQDPSARRDIIPPLYTVPYPWWGKPKKKLCSQRGMCFTMCPEYTREPGTSMFGARIPSTQETMQKAWMVSHFFHSCAPDYLGNFRVRDLAGVETTKRRRSAWWNTPGRVAEGSVLCAELIHVFGSPPPGISRDAWRALCPVK